MRVEEKLQGNIGIGDECATSPAAPGFPVGREPACRACQVVLEWPEEADVVPSIVAKLRVDGSEVDITRRFVSPPVAVACWLLHTKL